MLTAAAAREGRQAPSFETVRLSTDALASRGSVSEARLTELGARKIFDRTSLNLAVWLPLSEQAGGEPAIWPNSPPIRTHPIAAALRAREAQDRIGRNWVGLAALDRERVFSNSGMPCRVKASFS